MNRSPIGLAKWVSRIRHRLNALVHERHEGPEVPATCSASATRAASFDDGSSIA
jgi:hypothetical protein